MTSQSAPFPGSDHDVSCKQNGFIAGNDNNNSSATCILDPSSRLAIFIALPDAEAVIQWKCKASTSFSEVINQVCAEHGLDASLHVLVIENEEDDAVYMEGCECRPSNLVGLSKRRNFLLLPRTHLVKDPYSYKTMREQKKNSVTTVEMTNRVLVHLPQQKRVVIRISLKESVKTVFDQVCSEKQLYPPDFVVCHPDTREPLDMNKSLADYNIMEMLIEKITGPCESQTLPRRSGAGARAMVPSRTKAKSASKATGANVFNEDLSYNRGSYHGSSVSLAVDGVHGERRGKKASKMNAFLTFLKIKKKKKPRKDEVDGSIENLNVSPVSSPTRGRPPLLSGSRPVSAFIPPESLPAQRPGKKRRAPAPPSKSGRLNGEEEEGRLKAQAAVPGLSQSVPALPSLVPVQVDIEVEQSRQPAPDDKPRRRRAAPRPPTPPHDREDTHRAPPNFVAPPPPEEPPPADIPVTLKPYHEDKAVNAVEVSDLTMEVTEPTANVQMPKRAEHKLSINDNRKKSRIRNGVPLQASLNAGNGLTSQPQVDVRDISSDRDKNGIDLPVAPVLHVDKSSTQPEIGVVEPEVKYAPSVEAEVDRKISCSLPQVDNEAVELDVDQDTSLADVHLEGGALSLEPKLDVINPPLTQIEVKMNGDSPLDPELDITKSLSPQIEMSMNGDSSLEPHLSKDELLLPRYQDEIPRPQVEHLDESLLVEGIERDAGKSVDLNVRLKRKIDVVDLNFGVDDEESTSSESENEVKKEVAEEENFADRKVAVILMSSESRVFEDFNGSNFEEKCALDLVSTQTEDNGNDELRELICQETAAALVNSVIASAMVEYKAWNARSEKGVETPSEEGDKPANESKSAVYKTYVVQDEDQMQKKDISVSGDEEDREKRFSGTLEDHHFDIEMEKILSEDQEVHLVVDNGFKEEETSDESLGDESHRDLRPHQEEREEVFFTPADDTHPQQLQFTTSQETEDISFPSDIEGNNRISLSNLRKGDSLRDDDMEVSARVMDGDPENYDVEGSADAKGRFTVDEDVEGSGAFSKSLKVHLALDEEPEDQVFNTRTSEVVRKTESARSRCNELAFDPEAAEEDEQMEVKLVTPVCSPVKVQAASPVSSGTLHTDNDLPLSDTSSLAQRSTSPAWSAGSGGPRSIFLKAMEQPTHPVLESLEQQVEHWKDQLVLNRKRLEDSDSGGSYGQESLMQEQIKLQQALVEQMEKNISSLRARSSASEITSSSSACPSSRSVASDQSSKVAPAHVAPKITRQRDQHRDAAKPIFDSTVHLPQQNSSARAARMAARAGRRSESAKSDEM